MPFKNPVGLYALLALIPFILMYLRRPKPKEKTIPSLMFFMKEHGITKFSNFFKQMLRNLLFLLQLAILLSAAFSAASPYINSKNVAQAQHTAIVIDTSASMNAMLGDGSATRFEKAVEEASSRIDGKASIILAANIPVIIAEKRTAADARSIISTLRARATETHIGDAMLAAGELIEKPEKSMVVVISDYQSSQGTDIMAAKRSLAARGIRVELVNILAGESPGLLKSLSNVGFIQLDINKFQTTALAKNYDDEKRTVDIEILNNNKLVSEQQLAIGPRSLEPVSFDTLSGMTELRIRRDDDLLTDNILFISSPSKKIKALLITNSDSSNVMAALKSSPNVELDVAFPPVIKGFGYDAIIIHNASSQYMLPGFYKEINKAVANGSGLVVTAQESLPAYAKQFNMPIDITGMKNSSKASVKVENRLAKGVDFGVVARYFAASPQEGKSAFSTLVTADDGSPLIGTYADGNGMVAYYGLFDDLSSFKSSYLYPIFWDSLLSFLTKSDDIASFNARTGRIDGISEQQVETPGGKIRASRLFFDDAGFYSYGGKTIAANLLSGDESNIKSTEAFELVKDSTEMLVEAEKEESEFLLERKLAFAAIALLITEMLLVKMRGDL